MNKTCIVIADARVARFYSVEAGGAPREKAKLVEQATLTGNPDLETLGGSVSGRARTETNTNRQSGPVHPMEAQRERHRLEFERRFGSEIVSRAAEIVDGWTGGTIVLVAGPRLLGLVRAPLRKALAPGIELKELAKDYTGLAAPELLERLISSGLIAPPRGTAQ